MASVSNGEIAQSIEAATASTAAATTVDLPSPSKSFLENQEEGLLRDVLEELDRERSQRAELEAQVRTLEQELFSQKKRNLNNANLSTRDYLTIKAERDGYMEILDALTRERPAFSGNQTLPLHIVRMLEVMPWDPRARPYLFGQEQLHEWQIFSSYGTDKSWHKELRYFPTFFKTLPIVVPQPGKTVGEAPTSSSPPKQCVLTNISVTQILNIERGYPLPSDGGDWKWVGGWRIEKSGDTDEKGWSYSNDADILNQTSYYSELRMPKKGTKNFVKRRRKWTRSRVLVDYPHASAMTKQYLKLVAEKASVDVTVEKLSDQLVETKMTLTTLEADHMSMQENLSRKIAVLEQDLEERNMLLGMVGESSLPKLAETKPPKKDQVKELRSAVTQWVSNTVSKRQNTSDSSIPDGNTIGTEEGTEEDESSAKGSGMGAGAKQQMFESLKGKGSDLFEKLKMKGGEELEKIKQNSNSLPWPLKDKSSSKTGPAITVSPAKVEPNP